MKIPLFLEKMICFGKVGKNQIPISTKEKWMLLMLSGILLAVIFWPGNKKWDENDLLQDTRSDQSSGVLWQSSQGSQNNDGINDMYHSESSIRETFGEEVVTLKQYEAYLSGQLENILAQLEGVGKVQAWVTLSGSSEKVLYRKEDYDTTDLQEQDSVGGSRQEQTESVKQEVLLDSNGNPYVVKTLQPQVEGVLVVAEGANNSVIKKNITEAVEVLFDIEAHRIKVAKKKVEE